MESQLDPRRTPGPLNSWCFNQLRLLGLQLGFQLVSADSTDQLTPGRPDLPYTDTFFSNFKTTVVRHQRRRDFPELGDYSYAHLQDRGDGEEKGGLINKW